MSLLWCHCGAEGDNDEALRGSLRCALVSPSLYFPSPRPPRLQPPADYQWTHGTVARCPGGVEGSDASVIIETHTPTITVEILRQGQHSLIDHLYFVHFVALRILSNYFTVCFCQFYLNFHIFSCFSSLVLHTICFFSFLSLGLCFYQLVFADVLWWRIMRKIDFIDTCDNMTR